MTHFNKGPSYGLSAEVKNKVRAARGSPGFVCTGTTGRDGTRRDEARLGAPLPPAARGGPARRARWRRVRMRPPPARDSAALAAPLRKLAGTEELSAPGGPACGAAIRTAARAAPARAGSPGTGHPARAFSVRRDRPGRGAGARSRPGAGGAVRRAGGARRAEPGTARAGPPSGALRGSRPPRGAFQPHDIMGTGGARPMGAGPAQTRIVRPPRPAPAAGAHKGGAAGRAPRPAGSPASGQPVPTAPPESGGKGSADSSRAPRAERRAPVVCGFAEVFL